MPEQLIFALAPTPAPTFATFVAGPNGEVLAALRRFAAGELPETGLVLWGAAGAGKSHLLAALAAAAREAGRPVVQSADPAGVPEPSMPARALVTVDDVDRADATAQARLFTLYNALAAVSGQLVVASAVPPARMALRDDIRSRLGWGLVYEVVPLTDDAKPDALATFARQRGLRLSTEAIAYLLAHGRRDMASLVRSVTALDAHSLAHKRPITVPLIRAWLQHEMPFSPDSTTGRIDT